MEENKTSKRWIATRAKKNENENNKLENQTLILQNRTSSVQQLPRPWKLIRLVKINIATNPFIWYNIQHWSERNRPHPLLGQIQTRKGPNSNRSPFRRWISALQPTRCIVPASPTHPLGLGCDYMSLEAIVLKPSPEYIDRILGSN